MNNNKKSWIVTVDMGYGHQRTSYPLKSIAFKEKIINANNYDGIPERDRKIWKTTRILYEFISKFKKVPLIGEFVFSAFDTFQRILDFYPKRDLSKPNISLKQIYYLFKKGWGIDLIEKLKVSSEKIPLISSFFTSAFMAEFLNYPGEIYCIICDADISRTWAPLKPHLSRIKYFASTGRVAERLKLYGVKQENIFLTGYPLPKENIGTKEMEVLKEDLRHRILNLDPEKKYAEKYNALIEKNLINLPEKSDHPLTIMFAVGGAGAQKEIGIKIIKSLASKINTNQVKVILVAGIKENVKKYFEENIKKLGLKNIDPVRDRSPQGGRSRAFGRAASNGVEIIYNNNIEAYFESFNKALRKTDILWTKPSELSFYSALGLPIIIAPTIGSQEEFNKRWLIKSGFGILQKNPKYTEQWLFDWLKSGYLAEAAMQGFVEGRKLGTFNIEDIINKE